MRNLDDAGCMDDREWFQGLHAKRRQRERRRALPREGVAHTANREAVVSNRRYRAGCGCLLEFDRSMRASIWHRDLCLGGKSQVLCLSVSPLAENRFEACCIATWRRSGAGWPGSTRRD